jgi:DNA-directed RNA polymerase subunit K/omega
MNFKKTNAEVSTITRDFSTLDAQTANIYESLAVIAKRANQVSAEMKEELTSKLAEFASSTDNLEEVFENREQIEISKFYERLPKPASISIQEFLEDKIYFKNPAKENKSDF